MTSLLALGSLHAGERIFIIVGVIMTVGLLALFVGIAVMAVRSERKRHRAEAPGDTDADASEALRETPESPSRD